MFSTRFLKDDGCQSGREVIARGLEPALGVVRYGARGVEMVEREAQRRLGNALRRRSIKRRTRQKRLARFAANVDGGTARVR